MIGGSEIQPARGKEQSTISRHRRYCLEKLWQFIIILFVILQRIHSKERAEFRYLVIKVAYFCELVLNYFLVD